LKHIVEVATKEDSTTLVSDQHAVHHHGVDAEGAQDPLLIELVLGVLRPIFLQQLDLQFVLVVHCSSAPELKPQQRPKRRRRNGFSPKCSLAATPSSSNLQGFHDFALFARA
jgi:hypothetical protein